MEKLVIIVGGYIGLYPTGGATWDYLQYPLGLKLLGHDVYYIEDTMQYPVFQKNQSAWDDASGCVSYLKGIMDQFGFTDKWAYRDIASGTSYGMSEEKINKVCATADIFINISCSTFMRDEYMKIPKRILIDTDPMFTQIQYAIELSGDEISKNWNTKNMMDNHNYLFTFGENIGSPDCLIPQFEYKWLTTRQPICLDFWRDNGKMNTGCFTSIMNWSGRKKLIYDHDEWGQKDTEFEKIKEIPASLQGLCFQVVINKPLHQESYFDEVALNKLGWNIKEPQDTVATISDYQKFIFQSSAEFSVAKETYVKSNSGWFSCRSACYLASGRPVITQETKWSKFIPSGEGLFAFTDMTSAIDAIKEVNSNMAFHSGIAKQIADEYFDSSRVLEKMLQQLN
jgi:hypothetical protein